MWNIFDQPYTLLIAALLTLIILVALHTGKRLWWLVPTVIVLSAISYAYDFFVNKGLVGTDKITTIIIQAVLVSAIGILLIIQFVYAVRTTKRHRWQWLLPIFLAGAAFGADLFVQTDTEKINDLIKAGMKAVEQENSAGIDAILSEDYRDSSHNTKEALMSYCEALFSEPLVEKNTRRDLVLELSSPKATATLTVLTRFDKQSYVYRNFKSFLLTKIELNLQKESNGKWLISRAEILELDGQPAGWRHIK